IMLSFVGHLSDGEESGEGPTGNYRLRFSIYDCEEKEEANRPLWIEEQPVAVINGAFRVLLGSVVTLDRHVFEGAPYDAGGAARWIQLEVVATPSGNLSRPHRLGPRQRLPTLIAEKSA
ncbi:MAG: hypothetical protein ACRD1Z_19790, partial [Vicinamibacteria bacterium]